MDSHNKEINNNSFSNKNKNLVTSNQNRKNLSTKIEKYFSKSNLKSLEISYEKKIIEVKDLLMKFHLLYNSLNKIQTYMNKENSIKNINLINSEKNHKEKILLINKKSIEINKKSSNNNINVLNGTKKEKINYNKNNSINNSNKRFKIKSFKKINLLVNNINTNHYLSEKLKLKKISQKKSVRDINYKKYNMTSRKNLNIKKKNSSNYIIQLKVIFNDYKTKNFNRKKSPKSKSNKKDKNTQLKKRLEYSLKASKNTIDLNQKNFSKTISKNSNKNFKNNKNTYFKINKKLKLDKIRPINLTYENKNFSSENILRFTRSNYKDICTINISNQNMIGNKLTKSKENKFEQRYTLRNNNIKLKNKSLKNSKLFKKIKISSFNIKNDSNILFTKEKRNKKLKNNICFLFLTDNKNYDILKKIYNYLYIDENIKKGYNNYLRNIKGPLRDIYLNKCLSETKKQLDKYEDKNIEKDDDIWTIMEKEILMNKLNKINKYIEYNNS